MYLRLFHGRNAPDAHLDDWGFNGPIIKDVDITWTYGSIKVHGGDHDMVDLPIHGNDLVVFAGKYYGDFELIKDGDLGKCDVGIISFRQFKRIIEEEKEPAKPLKVQAKIQPLNTAIIFSVLDIDSQSISNQLIDAIEGMHTFEDVQLNENIYCPSGILECDQGIEMDGNLQEELNEILSKCNSNNCAYFRITYW